MYSAMPSDQNTLRRSTKELEECLQEINSWPSGQPIHVPTIRNPLTQQERIARHIAAVERIRTRFCDIRAIRERTIRVRRSLRLKGALFARRGAVEENLLITSRFQLLSFDEGSSPIGTGHFDPGEDLEPGRFVRAEQMSKHPFPEPPVTPVIHGCSYLSGSTGFLKIHSAEQAALGIEEWAAFKHANLRAEAAALKSQPSNE